MYACLLRQSSPQPLSGGISYTDYEVRVPLSYTEVEDSHSTEGIVVFVRELCLTKLQGKPGVPTLMYLQGGPGFAAPRPAAPPSGWQRRAIEEFRLLLVDQRGVGRSTPVTTKALEGKSAEEMAAYLRHFRADNIVRDCEAIRSILCPDTKISILGQSFGGFCALTYLSLYPGSLSSVLFTGGLPPIDKTADDIYRATYRRVQERNRRFYKRYPGDAATVRDIVRLLRDRDGIALPRGGKLTVRRFLQLGLGLGSTSGMETMHWLLENPFTDATRSDLSYAFLCQVEDHQGFDTSPIYAILHEAIYCWPGTGPSNWSADRLLRDPEFADTFNWEAKLDKPEEHIYFTGEMVYPWMFEGDYPQLAPLKDAAHILAQDDTWPALYNPDALRDTPVNCAALVYYDDMYVEREFSEATARHMGDNCKVWVTNRWQHSGLRDDGYEILKTLISITKDEIQIPS